MKHDGEPCNVPPPRRVSTFIDFWLGQKLRILRKDKGLSLHQLAAQCGLSVGTLSQVERGKTSASIKTLSRVADRLDIPLNSLLSNFDKHDQEADGWIARAKDHTALQMNDRNIVKEVITPQACQALDLYRAKIRPGGSTGDDLFVTEGGEIAGTVVSGCLELWLHDKAILLEEGDSFCYPSCAPRKWSNPGNTETYVLWAITRTPV